MVEKKVVGVNSLTKGSYVIIEGIACKVNDLQTSRPGKHGHAKIRVMATGLFDGRKKEMVMPGHDNVEVPIVDKRTAQVLSIVGTKANVMDVETYETFDLDIPEELKAECVDGIQVLYWVIMDMKIMKQIKSE